MNTIKKKYNTNTGFYEDYDIVVKMFVSDIEEFLRADKNDKSAEEEDIDADIEDISAEEEEESVDENEISALERSILDSLSFTKPTATIKTIDSKCNVTLFKNSYQASKETGVNNGTISRCCKNGKGYGTSKTNGKKYRFMFK